MKPDDHLRLLRDESRWADHDQWRPLTVPPAGAAGRASRWAVVGAVVAVVAAAAVVVVTDLAGSQNVSSPPGTESPTRPSSTAAPSPIPWRAIPAPRTTSTLTLLKVCEASALSATANPPGVGMGSYHLRITVRNHGPACALPAPLVTLRTVSTEGSRQTLATSIPVYAKVIPTVGAGDEVDYYVDFACSSSAAGLPATHPVFLGVNGRDVTVTGTALSDALVRCRAAMGAPDTTVEETYPGLTVSLDLPASAPSGSTLDYTVTLTNTGRKTIEFPVCPGYTESGNVFGKGGTTKRYRLNCAQIRNLSSGQSASYAMELPLPDAHGTLKIAWFLDGGPSSPGVVELR